jgi:alpha-ketoglutaric semialdehyde dehydrogenase
MNIGNRVGYQILSGGDSTFQTFNPRSNNVNQITVFEATDEEILLAVELAENAFYEFGKISGSKKSLFFLDIVQLIERQELELYELYCSESGLDQARAKVELTRTKNQILNFAALIASDEWRFCSAEIADKNRIPPKPELVKGLFPLGPVVVFGASNFPFAYSTIGGDSISALAAGCPVIVKSHPLHAGTGDLIAKIVIQAAIKNGMPEGVFSNLNSNDYTLGEKLIENPKIKAIGFTGSINGGKAIMTLAQKREEPIPVFAEMGSSNPIIILPSVLRDSADLWSVNLSNSITNSAGQFCTKPGLLFLVKDEFSLEFISMLVKNVVSKDFQCMLSSSMCYNYNKILKEREGLVKLNSKQGDVKPNYAKPTIGICNSSIFLANEFLAEEVFGPFSLVVECENIDSLKRCISSLKGQLTGTILSNSNKELFETGIIDLLQLKVGRMIYNDVPTGVEVVESMQHGGPFPSSSESQTTAVGLDAIYRFVRPICFQNYNYELLTNFLK